MANLFELTAETRQTFGTSASRRLRRVEDRVPAILYGSGEPPLALSFKHNHLKQALEHEAFYSHILTIYIDETPHQAVLKDLQRHPFKPRILHLDLLRITGKEKITMTVPLHFKGEEVSPGVKESKGVVSHLVTSVEIRCLPADLPESIEVDLSNLKLDESFNLSDLKLGAGIELVDLAHGNDAPVATIHPQRAEEEEPVSAPISAEVPAINVKADDQQKEATGKEKGKGKDQKK